LRDKGIVVPLVLCGTNAESRLYLDIKKAAESLGLSGCVLHIGFVDEGEKRAIYKLANSTVVPSIGESFCLSIWEAFWLGCPVVASSDRDIPEQVGDAALICDPLDPEDIAEKIRIFWEDDGLRSEYAKKGYDRVSSLSGQTLLGEWSGILSAH
jgi:glycosyltransferase involved in cell wall biosynthesis